MLNSMEEHRGYIKKVVRTFDSGDMIAEADVESRAGIIDMIVVGPFDRFVKPGDWFVMTGKTKPNTFRGRTENRFHARSILPDLPRTKAGVLALLDRTFNSKDHGIALDVKKKFVDTHGVDTAFKIEKNPEILFEMSSNKAQFEKAIKTAWSRRVTSLRPLRILENAGAAPQTCSAILKKFKDETNDILNKNPYQLLKVRSVNFELADKIASKLGIEQNDPRRVSAGVTEVVSQSLSEGNTYVPINGIRDSLQTFGIEWDSFKALAKSVSSREGAERLGVTIFNSSAGKVVQKYDTYCQERDIADSVTDLVERGRKLDHKKIDAVAKRVLAQDKYSFLSDEQRRAVFSASRESLAILTGGPGTGKSTVSDAIAEIAIETIKGPLLLTAPTGKAARRLSETTNREASTVHKLLGTQGELGVFNHNENNPLPSGCFVLVDESSMLDTNLAKSLLDALPSDGRILFVGDKDQLPSVDAGYVLGDMLTAKAKNGNAVPSAELTEVFRSKGADSLIASYAKNIKEGEFDVSCVDSRLKGGIAFFEYSKDSIITQVEHLYCNLAESALNLNPMRDVIILCPMRKGKGGTHEVNRRIQATANPRGAHIRDWVRPPELDKDEPTPRLGDRVMFTKNDNDLNIRNGDVGIINKIVTDWGEKKKKIPAIEVELESGDIVHVPVNQAGYCTVVAYAITGHKSQGSQYSCVIMPVSPDHVSMMERTLLYTEWTRAKKYVILVGDKEVFQNGIENTASSQRMTLLKNHIEDRLDKIEPANSMKSTRKPAVKITEGLQEKKKQSAFVPPSFLNKSTPFKSPFSN